MIVDNSRLQQQTVPGTGGLASWPALLTLPRTLAIAEPVHGVCDVAAAPQCRATDATPARLGVAINDQRVIDSCDDEQQLALCGTASRKDRLFPFSEPTLPPLVQGAAEPHGEAGGGCLGCCYTIKG